MCSAKLFCNAESYFYIIVKTNHYDVYGTHKLCNLY